MTTLHTVNKSPFEKTSLQTCLDYATGGAAVLLIEDGVYGALAGTTVESRVKSALDSVKIYVLGPDLKARGFAPVASPKSAWFRESVSWTMRVSWISPRSTTRFRPGCSFLYPLNEWEIHHADRSEWQDL